MMMKAAEQQGKRDPGAQRLDVHLRIVARPVRRGAPAAARRPDECDPAHDDDRDSGDPLR